MTEIAVTGAAGRMGREVLAAAADRDDITVAFAVNRSSVAEPISGVAVDSSDDFAALLADYEPAVVVDFTAPDSTIDYANACAEAHVAFVTGTTGFEPSQPAALHAASESTAVRKASNF